VPSPVFLGGAAPAPPPLPPTPRTIKDEDELELRLRFKAGELVDLMGPRTDTKGFSEAIAKLIRRYGRQAAREPRTPTRRERAEALWPELEKRFPRWPATRPPGPRSLFDYAHPEFLPIAERRRQSYRVSDAREDVPDVGPPRPDKLVVLPVEDHGSYSHARRMKAWLPHTQREIWLDLNPPHDGGGIGRGDGDVLAFLMFAGVTPPEWEGLAPKTRISIRESIRELLLVKRAVAVALDPLDPKLAERAVAFLQKLSSAVVKGRRSPRGFVVAFAQREKWAAGRGLHQFIVYVFDLVKVHFRRELLETGCPKAPQFAGEMNTLLTERYGQDAARCIRKDIEALASQSSADAAIALVRRINPKVDTDSLGRSRPRHRNRPKKAARRTGPTGQ
jgi:hypothetical protein